MYIIGIFAMPPITIIILVFSLLYFGLPYTAYITLYGVACPLYSVECQLYSIEYSPYSVEYSLYSVECSLYSVE